jgi:hypothetical protein
MIDATRRQNAFSMIEFEVTDEQRLIRETADAATADPLMGIRSASKAAAIAPKGLLCSLNRVMAGPSAGAMPRDMRQSGVSTSV